MIEVIIRQTKNEQSPTGFPYSQMKELRFAATERDVKRIMEMFLGSEEVNKEMAKYDRLQEDIKAFSIRPYREESNMVGALMQKTEHITISLANNFKKFYRVFAKDCDILKALKNGEIEGVIPELAPKVVSRWNRVERKMESKVEMRPDGKYQISVSSLVRWLESNYQRKQLPDSISKGLDMYLIKE